MTYLDTDDFRNSYNTSDITEDTTLTLRATTVLPHLELREQTEQVRAQLKHDVPMEHM